MSTLRISRVAALLSVLLSVIAYSIADRFALLAVATIPVAVLGWWLTEVKRLTPVPKVAINLLVTVSIVWSFYRVISDRGVEGLTVSVFCQFLVLILLVKLWDRKDSRDVAQVLTLSVFLTIGAILTANTLGLGVAVMLNVLVTAFAVMSFHVAAGIDRLNLAAQTARCTPPSRADDSRDLRGTFLGLFAASLSVGVLVSILVWVVMPRGIGESEFGGFGQFGGRRTGFTERVDLRRSGLISESTRTVLELRLENREGYSIGTEGKHVYLRGAVLDAYDGRSWTKSAGAGQVSDMKVQAGTPWQIGPADGNGAMVQKIVMRDVASTGVPVLAALDPVSIELEADAQLAFRHAARTLSRDGRAGRFAYTVVSIPPKSNDERNQLVRTTVARFQFPRIAQEARRVLSEAGIEPDPELRPPAWDQDACRALEKYLRSSFTYTLDTPSVRAGQDPIEAFLFEHRSGHCEYFASAMAAMARGVGIPARVVAGYVANEFSLETETYTVRENSAHAWVEAMIDEGVWATFDPTPPDGLLRQIRPPARFLAGWQHWLDSLDDAWSTSVVTFDEQSRKKLLGGDVNPANWIQEHLARWAAEFHESDSGTRVRAALRVLGTVAGTAILMWGSVRVFRAAASVLRDRPERESRSAFSWAARPTDPSARSYFQLLVVLRRLGIAKPEWRPPLTHADEIGTSTPAAAALRRAALLYYAARFGRQSPSHAELEEVRACIADLRRHPISPVPQAGGAPE